MAVLKAWPWALAALSGTLGWSGQWTWVPLCLGVIVSWVFSSSRTQAFGGTLLYYALASRDLVRSAAQFFDASSPRWTLSIALWFGANALLALVWGALWSPRLKGDVSARLWRGTACAVLLAVPPWGLFGWAHPWTATGVLWPGSGFAGLALVQVACLGATKRTALLHAGALASASWLLCASYQAPSVGEFGGQSTSFGRIEARGTALQFDRAQAVRRLLEGRAERVMLLPEGVGGVWSPTTELLWELQGPEGLETILVGALSEGPQGRHNGLAVVGIGKGWFWAQRVPPPFGMWAPWSQGHVQSGLLSEPIHVMAGRRTTLLMCFEQLVMWPVMQSAWLGAEVVLAPANLWFARGTRLNTVRAATLRAWARLFDWHVVEAINE